MRRARWGEPCIFDSALYCRWHKFRASRRFYSWPAVDPQTRPRLRVNAEPQSFPITHATQLHTAYLPLSHTTDQLSFDLLLTLSFVANFYVFFLYLPDAHTLLIPLLFQLLYFIDANRKVCDILQKKKKKFQFMKRRLNVTSEKYLNIQINIEISVSVGI